MYKLISQEQRVQLIASSWFTWGCGNHRAYFERKTQMYMLFLKEEGHTRYNTYHQGVFLHFRQACILKQIKKNSWQSTIEGPTESRESFLKTGVGWPTSLEGRGYTIAGPTLTGGRKSLGVCLYSFTPWELKSRAIL